MEQEKNLQTVQQLYADFGNGNIEGVLNVLTEDVSWTDPGYPDIPYAGKRNGKKEVQDYFEKLLNTITFTAFDPQEFYADKDAVIVKGSFTGKLNSSGKTVGDEWVMIWKFANGKIYFYRLWTDTLTVARSMQ